MDNDRFFERVYEVVRQIPDGRVSTYGAIAGYLGSAGAARMVGWAMNASHTSESYVPAHRVVNRIGLLTGRHHFHGEQIMQQLLESEGVQVDNNQVQRFDSVFWNPAKELIS